MFFFFLKGQFPSETSTFWSLNTDLQFVLFPVDDDSGDLLVHKNENGDQQCWECGCQVHPPGVPPERRDKPAPAGIGGLEREEEEEESQCNSLLILWINLMVVIVLSVSAE